MGQRPDYVYGEVAEGANRLPLPWLLCFRPGDLRPVGGDWVPLKLPCTTVEQAVRNLESSLPVFEAIAGDAALARPYWKLACAMLRRLPQPYLTMEPRELFQLSPDPPQLLTERMAGAFAGDLSAVPHLKHLTGYAEGVPPYPIDVLYAMPGGQRNEERTWNASILDGGFQPNFQYVRWATGPKATAPPAPPPAPMTVFGDLYGVPRLLEAWIKKEDPNSAGVELGLWPGNPEKLRLDIYARTGDDLKRLEANAPLRQRLGEFAQQHLVPWCKRHGLAWDGHRIAVPEWARR